MKIQIRNDLARGCGWRKPGGLYLVATGFPTYCGRLPIPLDVCPCCGQGIKQSRGWTWVDLDQLAKLSNCKKGDCGTCPLSRPLGRVGLLWIGECFYPTAEEYCRETMAQGISRRIARKPRGFILGETWVCLAHSKVIEKPEFGKDDPRRWTPAIFQIFKPTAVEYVVEGNETEEQIDEMTTS